MSDLESPQSSREGGEPLAAAPSAQLHWKELFDELGASVAGRLMPALERIQALAATGRISRQDLRALREEVESARQASVISQQLVRVASGQARQARERVNLANVLGATLGHRGHEADRRGLHVSRILAPVEVTVDPALLTSLVDTMLDWVFSRAHSAIELRTAAKLPPAQADLTCAFAERSAPRRGDGGAIGPTNDSLVWQLLEQTATVMGARLQCSRAPTQTLLTIEFSRAEFPRTEGPDAHGPRAHAPHEDRPASGVYKTVAGHHVLVLAARNDLRSQIREAIHAMGLIVDFVESVDAASAFCAEGLPHAIVFDTALQGEQFDRLREQIRAEAPNFSYVAITERDDRFEISSRSGDVAARVGRVALATALPSALTLELCKSA